MKPRITTAQIYAARNVRATLDGAEQARVREARDLLTEVLSGGLPPDAQATVTEARDKLTTALGESTAPGATGAPLGHWHIQARQGPLDLERGRAVAPRPRSLADIARNYYTQSERRPR